MKKAKIYKPSKTAMQSGYRKSKNWILEFDTLDTKISPLMGWESSLDTMSEIVADDIELIIYGCGDGLCESGIEDINTCQEDCQ